MSLHVGCIPRITTGRSTPPPPGWPPGKNTVQVILLMGRYAAIELSAYRIALDMGSGAREGGGASMQGGSSCGRALEVGMKECGARADTYNTGRLFP